ncbi:glutamine amidotransferase-related protein [Caballeronia grimmiae]|uniref:glutamine amidotransferase-related protein n=1 Tax=Caballeronia grimmiae TaxID=1071679 RepID=UPI0038BD3E49
MLYLIEDATPEPAQFGALPALFARTLNAELRCESVHFDEQRFPDAYQHVTADGRLVASGLIWRTRTGLPDTAEPCHEIFALARTRNIVLLVQSFDAFPTQCAEDVEMLRVVHQADSAQLVEDGSGVVLQAHRDRYGRWRSTEESGSRASGPSVTIALIGRECDQHQQYPATLAALGDAADALSFDLDVRFVAAQDIDRDNAETLLADAHGILLPGAIMAHVAGQIEAARFGWLASTPVVGLCLGMQSMATAIARLALKSDEIGMREAQPDVRVASVEPIHVGEDGVLLHRSGLRPISLVPGSRIAAMLGAQASILCNHRYRLNPALKAPLATLGVTVSAHDDSGSIADAIEADKHPFFAGMQGHPELSSRDGAPHPLLTGFLEAAARRS